MDEAEMHRMQLEALKKNDPEFYAHLQKSDSSLLQFMEDDEEDDAIVSAIAEKEQKEEAATEAPSKKKVSTC